MSDGAIQRDLLDEVGYLSNFNDFLDLVEEIYREADIQNVVETHQLIVVGGQALAFWYARYLLGEHRYDQFQAAYSNDLDFFGVKSSVEFCENRLGIPFNRPENFDPTVNLAMLMCKIGTPEREVIIDIIHQVGGLADGEVYHGVELLPVRGFDVPVINPLLCLKSRIHNFYAHYKADKRNELERTLLCIRFVKLWLQEKLEDEGWNKDISQSLQAIFELCLSLNGRKMFCKNGVDFLKCIPDCLGLMHPSFVEKQLPRMIRNIGLERERYHAHLLRFNADEYDGTHTFTP